MHSTAPGGAEQVAQRALGRGEHRVVADRLLDRDRLGDVADHRRRRVAVDVPDVGRVETRRAQRRGDRPRLARCPRGRGR